MASTPKVPSSTTGTAIVGMIVARMFCRKTNITRKTSPIASNSVLTTSWIDSSHERRRVIGINDLDALRKGRGQARQRVLDVLRRADGVGAGRQLDGEGGRRQAVVG